MRRCLRPRRYLALMLLAGALVVRRFEQQNRVH